ncbi:MAG: hypothetical protein K8G79_07445 [bacterium]|uniref:Uncharacterized protein n=1 Tax=Candidatus Methylomirabilis tolerans TaxID=3123416 RepID=A0AAJ1AI87_9BACT|nr:hypothetical protein [Candidatus Methylomirabilis sp.]
MGQSMMTVMAGFAVVFVAGLSVGWAQQATVTLVSPKEPGSSVTPPPVDSPDGGFVVVIHTVVPA